MKLWSSYSNASMYSFSADLILGEKTEQNETTILFKSYEVTVALETHDQLIDSVYCNGEQGGQPKLTRTLLTIVIGKDYHLTLL